MRVMLLLLTLLIGVVPAQAQGISAIWANDGGDKVLQEERRASGGLVIAPANGITNTVWDGNRVRLFGARNETVSFVLVIEAEKGASGVSVGMDALTGPGGAVIGTRAARAEDVFDYRGRDIELFHVRYLSIKGVSILSYDLNDERWVPSKMRRPFKVSGNGRTTHDRGAEGWEARPGADKHFPEIAVPLEVHRTFDVAANGNQSIWADIHIPKTATPGIYRSALTVAERGADPRRITVELDVRDFALPDTPSALATAPLSIYDISERFLGKANRFIDFGDNKYPQLLPILERYWQQLKRHRVMPMADESYGMAPPKPPGIQRLNGTMYSATKGYDGPGKDVGDPMYFIGVYGGWKWQDRDQAGFNQMSDAWMTWFAQNAPTKQKVLYLIDEPNLADAAQAAKVNGWLDKLAANPGPGRALPTLITGWLKPMREKVPRVNVTVNWFSVADTAAHGKLIEEQLAAAKGNQVWQYNGKRPASGSFATEDDGTALRVVQWAAYKKKLNGWFYWNTSYYVDYQGGAGPTDVWRKAKTFGPVPVRDAVRGETSGTYSNGDGVLQYPGLDMLFLESGAPNLMGPVASLRLKLWRRGIQDGDYLTLAAAKNPVAVQRIVERMVPKVLWEVGVSTSRDPTYQYGGTGDGIGWTINPDAWENARRELADIIEGK